MRLGCKPCRWRTSSHRFIAMLFRLCWQVYARGALPFSHLQGPAVVNAIRQAQVPSMPTDMEYYYSSLIQSAMSQAPSKRPNFGCAIRSTSGILLIGTACFAGPCLLPLKRRQTKQLPSLAPSGITSSLATGSTWARRRRLLFCANSTRVVGLGSASFGRYSALQALVLACTAGSEAWISHGPCL